MSWTLISNIRIPLLFALTACSCGHGARGPVPFPRKAVVELDAYVSGVRHRPGRSGIAVVVIKGDAVYYRTTGNRRCRSDEPFTDSTVFFTGNLSEPLLATAMLKLAGEGKVNLDSPVVDYLSYFKMAGASYRDITIRHLLTHSSGVPKHSADWDIPNVADNSLELTTHSISLQEPKFMPAGSRIVRSPYNYDILADLIAKVSRTSFEDAVSRLVFQPLGMRSSTFLKSEIPEGRLVYPCGVELYPYNREHAGSIGFHTTVTDMARWMYMLLHNGSTGTARYLGEKWGRELVRPQLGTGDETYIGLGWEIKRTKGALTLSKSHQMGGFSEALMLEPGQSIGVLVVGNTGEDLNAGAVAEQLMAWLKKTICR